MVSWSGVGKGRGNTVDERRVLWRVETGLFVFSGEGNGARDELFFSIPQTCSWPGEGKEVPVNE